MSNNSTFLSFFDKLGKKPQLYVRNRSRYTSVIGSIASLIVYSGIIAIALFFLVEYLFGSGMSVIYSKDNLVDPIFYDLNRKIFMIRFMVNTGIEHIDPRIASVNGIFVSHKFVNATFSHIPFEPCTFERHFPDKQNQELLTNYDLSNFTCISPEFNLTLLFDDIKHDGSYFYIYLSKCTNSTANNNFCFSPDVIEESLNNATYYISFVLENNEIDHFNETNPFKPKVFLTNIMVTTSINYDYTFYWKKVSYKSDHGLFYNTWKYFDGFQLDNSLTETVINTNSDKYFIPNTFSSFKFTLHPIVLEKYQRIYPKIQSYIANVSGLMNLLINTGELFISAITTGLYYAELSNNLQIEPERSQTFFNLTTKGSQPTKTEAMPEKSKVKLDKCTSIQWIFCPKLNKGTKDLTKSKIAIRNLLTIENILQKMCLFDHSSPKKESSSYLNLLQSNCKNNPKNNNYLSPQKSYGLIKQDITSNVEKTPKHKNSSNKLYK